MWTTWLAYLIGLLARHRRRPFASRPVQKVAPLKGPRRAHDGERLWGGWGGYSHS